MNDPIAATRVFLDANVLFSASIGGRVGALWRLGGVALVTSEYAVVEVWRNLPRIGAGSELEAAEARFQRLIEGVEVYAGPGVESLFVPAPPALPDRDDVPILMAAVESHCAYLLTGDRKCFGKFLGTALLGVTILTLGAFLEQWAR